MDKNLEAQLNELMNKNQRKFTELVEKAASTFREKYNKEIFIKSKEKLRILDGSVSQDYFSSLEMVDNWMDKCIDEIRNNIRPISYPLFVYLFLELILKDLWADAKKFFQTYSSKYPAFQRELEQLELLKEPLNHNLPLVSGYLKNKVHIYIPRTIFDFFIHFLNTNHLILVLDILNKYFERSNILSKLGNDTEQDNNRFLLLNHSGEDIERINSRTSIYYNKFQKENEVLSKGKGKFRGEKSILSKILIPFPEQVNDFVPIDIPMMKINKRSPPTIGCFTILNSNNKLNCADMTNSGSIVVCGFKDGGIMVWVLDNELNLEITESKIKTLEEYKDTNISSFIGKGNSGNDQGSCNANIIDIALNRKELKLEEPQMAFDENNIAYELLTDRHRRFNLYGHTDSIYSLSISPDNENIVSGSFDGTIRLWNLHTKSTIAVYRGHFAPILCVKFSPFSHYFASGGCDRTARLWAINSSGALRIFAGHLSDVELVDFHPNSLYLITAANDKTIRLWIIESGECCRIFFNYSDIGFIDCLCFSNSGKLLVVGADKGVIVYDLVKMGDPVSIIKNLTTNSITSISFDNDDSVIVCSTEDYKVSFFDMESILNSEDNLQIDNQHEQKVEMLYSYMTKKTTILSTKCTTTNIMLILGRFDDNDPKIFM